MATSAAEEPGVPTSVPSLGKPADGSVEAMARARAQRLLAVASAPDRIILRLNKLLASPGGLSSFLSTFNYTLYLLAYLETKTLPLRASLVKLVNALLNTSFTALPATAASPSRIAALGAILSQTRTYLRLFALPPLYASMRQLMQGPKPGQDPVLYATAVTQCSLYLAFQGLENVAVLTDNKVLPPSVTARWNKSGNTGRIYLWSFRTWLAALLCDFVRLSREAQLTNKARSEKAAGEKVALTDEEQKADQRWWAELMVPLGWTPMAAQYSFESGLPGWNLGIMGVCGLVAGLGRTAALWASTA